MSEIIIASANEQDLREGTGDIERLTRRQEKQFARVAKQAVTIEKLPMLVSRIVDPAFTVMQRDYAALQLTVVALKEIVAEKLNLSEDEMNEMFNRTLERLQQTPNSPALEESQANAVGEVKRLDEPAVVVETETAPRRLLEG
jgi:hypothetical protein